MAKRSEEGEQLQLIETDHPEAKALKRLIGKYEGLVNDRKACKVKENEARDALVEKVRSIGTVDALGNIRVSINGVSISIEPDEKVKVKHGDDVGEDEAPDDGEGGEPELSERCKK